MLSPSLAPTITRPLIPQRQIKIETKGLLKYCTLCAECVVYYTRGYFILIWSSMKYTASAVSVACVLFIRIARIIKITGID